MRKPSGNIDHCGADNDIDRGGIADFDRLLGGNT
jgi:hypothetical protein